MRRERRCIQGRGHDGEGLPKKFALKILRVGKTCTVAWLC